MYFLVTLELQADEHDIRFTYPTTAEDPDHMLQSNPTEH